MSAQPSSQPQKQQMALNRDDRKHDHNPKRDDGSGPYGLCAISLMDQHDYAKPHQELSGFEKHPL